MSAIKFWEEMSSENKTLAKKIGVLALLVYISFQLLALLFPVLLTFGISYWAYKNFVSTNPRVLK